MTIIGDGLAANALANAAAGGPTSDRILNASFQTPSAAPNDRFMGEALSKHRP
ncbi:hypothetical protein Q8W71_19630 [Methylobacterium sp. NEAU 140]|uniref:hypothetical protein n=1 Tax=Methylobacterium sp. NEAU 140 TaxID=3064945 RepID=UPI0027339930|nr:hypothetical protein [Methylobacterium sp. NEAU 140]MDP4024845.1 hypothetical protein [Methylobacterium sp. NEAU 140]